MAVGSQSGQDDCEFELAENPVLAAGALPDLAVCLSALASQAGGGERACGRCNRIPQHRDGAAFVDPVQPAVRCPDRARRHLSLGQRLPADITYASYAHRGAYPLILTALLAAGFVLISMRPGGPAEQSKVIRPLVYLWVAQNVMMVVSSILRLDLYVQTYLLTYW